MLFNSIRKNDITTVSQIISFYKPDLNYMNEKGETSLSVAQSVNNEEIIKILKDAGATNMGNIEK